MGNIGAPECSLFNVSVAPGANAPGATDTLKPIAAAHADAYAEAPTYANKKSAPLLSGKSQAAILFF
ncbi:hypothetical protein KDH_39960 [Dictyobacter sp. S3.2.2.5]|uniref:Uncharacterized protein n=1 Tax=Dictyobacter halimunensis TaxID=3026934 RepID=A0ABQ6FVY3_9CHLR|nr:hypothetical protein KDH_39960 [Dictyobacter sp. S3.2.2.5]